MEEGQFTFAVLVIGAVGAATLLLAIAGVVIDRLSGRKEPEEDR